MKMLITITCLIAATGSCFAQSDLVFYDASGSRAGSLVQLIEDSSCDRVSVPRPEESCNAILRQGTFLTGVTLTTGEISAITFWYQSADCTGQPHILEVNIGTRGGRLLSKNDSMNPVLVEVEWYPNYETVSLKSFKYSNGDCSPSGRNELAMIPTIVDPAKYGMKEIPVNGSKGIGFQGPLTPVNERADGIFCNSFENCPTP